MVPYLIQTLPVISDISVNCVFLYRLGKHRVGGAVVVNLWGGCVTVDKDPRSRSPTLGLGQGGGTWWYVICYSVLSVWITLAQCHLYVIINAQCFSLCTADRNS